MEKVNSYVDRYYIKWDFLNDSDFKKVYYMGQADHYYFSPGSTRGDVTDKEANLKIL